jgi:hexulose-6-phosphate isomerase
MHEQTSNVANDKNALAGGQAVDRRRFVVRSAGLAASGVACAWAAQSAGGLIGAELPQHKTAPRRLLKTLKIGMVKVEGSLTEKFKAVKAAGFDGIELNCPGIDVKEVRHAIEESGLPVDGSVCATHWQITHTHPDAKVRAQALADLQSALRQTHAVGGHTVLLVVGVGKDGPETEIWPRAVENIRQAIPLAAELGVTIAIENVWNQFLYDHNGPSTQSADKFVKFVDEFHSPFVGMQFDIGNHWKYGNMAEWIRTLKSRIVKLDIKGFSRKENKFTDITEDDIDWVDVRQALDDIHFHGWVAAEVGGGDPARLAKIARQIDQALNIGG